MPAQRRPVPLDLREIARVKTATQLRDHYRVRGDTLTRWLRDGGIEPMNARKTSHNARDMPHDFATVAQSMTKQALARHYGVKWCGTVNRWLREAGVFAKAHVPRENRLSWMGRIRPAIAAPRQDDEYDEAANALRRERYYVNRCNADGKFDIAGKFWRVGRTVLTPGELLEKAGRFL